MSDNKQLANRGYLMHITHYDPKWCEQKENEQPFDLETGLAMVNAMAEARLNILIIDCADGLIYKSHPELKRHYSVPMDYLKQIISKARENKIKVIPKLNFSQSKVHRHNHWFRPHNELADNKEYWQKAFEVIDELLEVFKPCQYFHIGMDEDHDRSHEQYIQAIKTLHGKLQERDLGTIIWNDTALKGSMSVHAEKSLAAEHEIPKDIIPIVWDYTQSQPEIVQRLVKKGFEVWGAPGRSPERVSAWRDCLLENGGTGILLTAWIPNIKDNEKKLLKVIKESGPLC